MDSELSYQEFRLNSAYNLIHLRVPSEGVYPARLAGLGDRVLRNVPQPSSIIEGAPLLLKLKECSRRDGCMKNSARMSVRPKG